MFSDTLKLFFLNTSTLSTYLSTFTAKFGLVANFNGANATSAFDIRKSGFFLLTPSPWPLFSSFAVFLMLTGFAAYMNYYVGGLFCFFLGVFFVVLAFFF